MPHRLLRIVLNLNEIAKKNQTGPIACHWCNNQDSIIKYGTYQRYEFSGQGRIRIQMCCIHGGQIFHQRGPFIQDDRQMDLALWPYGIISPLLHCNANDVQLCEMLSVVSQNNYIHPHDGRCVTI